MSKNSDNLLTPEEVDALLSAEDGEFISMDRISEIATEFGVDIDGLWEEQALLLVKDEVRRKSRQLRDFLEQGVLPRDYPELELMELEELELLYGEVMLVEFELLLG